MGSESVLENPMFFLVYVSSATRPFSREDLRVLLETCWKNNAELGVTEMLVRAPSFAKGSAGAGPDLGRQDLTQLTEAHNQAGRGGSGKNSIRRGGGTSNADRTKIMQGAASGTSSLTTCP